MGKTVEFALDTERNSSYGLRKASPSKNSMIGQGEAYPRWRGPGYKEPNNDPNYDQEDTKNDAKISNDDTKTLYEKLNPEQEINEKEWWMKLEKLKHQNLSNVKDAQEEIVIKINFGIQGASILQNFARQLDLHYRIYNQGEDSPMIVISRSPLPSYRHNLIEQPNSRSSSHHIFVPSTIEHKIETMLASISQDNSKLPEKRVVNWLQSKIRISQVPIRSHKQLTLINNLNKDIHDSELYEYQNTQKESKRNKAIQAFRQTLPVYKLKEKFLKTVAENKVVVVSGDTGLGKTTQLPQFILDKAIEDRTGNTCNIICTQPRRISAMSVATRVATERCEPLGLTIDYQLRSETKMSPQTKLLYCTTAQRSNNVWHKSYNYR